MLKETNSGTNHLIIMEPSHLHPWSYYCFGIAFVFFLLVEITVQDGLQLDSTEAEKGDHLGKRFMLKTPDSLWTYGVIPFTFNANMDEASIREVEVAMSVYHYYTPIRFVPKNDTRPGTLGHDASADFIKEQGYSCHSKLGRQKEPNQKISCCKRTTCIHEIGHLLGFEHETAHPDRNQWIRMNWNSIPLRGMHIPFLQQGDRSIFNVPPYDLSSFMHYIPYNYRSGPRFDILFSELTVNKRIFYMFKELCDVYKCHEFPQCYGQSLECKNEGYVSVVGDECSCICLPGFDQATRCTQLLKSVFRFPEFPRSLYAFPKNGDRCPMEMSSLDLGWIEGLSLCQHDIVNIGETYDWPRGTYCFLAVDSSCPTHKAIRQSKLTYRTSDGDIQVITFCCLENDIPRNPVGVHVGTPFSLIMHHERACQTFVGMRVEERGIALDANAMTLTDGPFTTVDGSTRYIYACDYTPIDINCGGIVELNNTHRTIYIEVNWTDPSNKDCTWVIKGPEEKGALVLDFQEFNEMRKVGEKCVDFVEVKHVRLGQAGIRYCGEPIRHSIRSVYNNMTVRFQTSDASKAKFKAVITWNPGKDWCYSEEDSGRSYAGHVNYTRRFESCLPWMEALKCAHNPYSESDQFHMLHGNACRNPDNSLRPWCYTEVGLNHPNTPYVNCRRDFCDVCHLESLFDKLDNCTDLKLTGFCTDDKAHAIEKCPKTCSSSDVRPIVTKASEVRCGSPGNISNSDLVDGRQQESYRVGDTVTHKCRRDGHFTIQRMCWTTGEWSVANTACTECPVGFSYHHTSCYGFVDNWVTYQEAIDECEKMGASLVSVSAGWENDFIYGLIPEGTDSTWLGGRIEPKNEKVTITWEDGTPPTFQPSWSRQIMVPRQGIPLVMSYYEGRWDAKPDDTRIPFVCKLPSKVDADCLDVYNDCHQLIGANSTDVCTKHPKMRNVCRESCGLCQEILKVVK